MYSEYPNMFTNKQTKEMSLTVNDKQCHMPFLMRHIPSSILTKVLTYLLKWEHRFKTKQHPLSQHLPQGVFFEQKSLENGGKENLTLKLLMKQWVFLKAESKFHAI
jgi:hypothetical protein